MLDLNADDVDALLGMAAVRSAQENFDDLRNLYAKLAGLKSDSAEILFNAGLLEQKAERPPRVSLRRLAR